MRSFLRPAIFLLFWLFASPTALRAQKASLTGTVIDAATGQAVPFATVEIPRRQLGVQATEAGTFMLEMPGVLAATDSLRVASLGYATRMLLIPSVSPCKLGLAVLAVPLPEVMVRTTPKARVQLGPTGKAKKLGYLEGGRFSSEGSTGWQIARLFKEAPTGYLQAVRYYVAPNDDCGNKTVQTPFRVRIYAADGPDGAPGRDLLNTSIVTSVLKEGWHEVSLAPYQIDIPATGFYVAMEWLFTSPDFGCEVTAKFVTTPKEAGGKVTRERKPHYTYGQKLGGYIDASPKATWIRVVGKAWQWQNALRLFTSTESNPNAAIQAIIQPD